MNCLLMLAGPNVALDAEDDTQQDVVRSFSRKNSIIQSATKPYNQASIKHLFAQVCLPAHMYGAGLPSAPCDHESNCGACKLYLMASMNAPCPLSSPMDHVMLSACVAGMHSMLRFNDHSRHRALMDAED